MKKKEIMNVVENFVNFEIKTPYFTSKHLNKDQIKFVSENVIELFTNNSDAIYINADDIVVIKGFGRL